MKFCDKLTKVRKENNFSQEQLAEMLNVSRQSVSKWESGSSYPDMDRILQICKVLNCNLEDLMDDGALGEKVTSATKKFSWQDFMEDFLSFIRRVYNMFCVMKTWQRIKCVFELVFIAGMLFIISLLAFNIVNSFILGDIQRVPIIGHGIEYVLARLIKLCLLTVSSLIWFNLFKMRYLDYYITIEDKNVEEQKVEKAINNDGKQEKIIIRDPKHSSNRFFVVLAKIILFFVKIFAVRFTMPFVFGLVLCVALVVALLLHSFSGIIFLWAAVGMLGAALVMLFFVDMLYHFIFNQKRTLFVPLFIVLITGIVFSGIGFGGAFGTLAKFEKADDEMQTERVELSGKPFYANNISYDENVPFRYVDIISSKENKQIVKESKDFYCVNSENGAMENYKLFMNDIKAKRIRDYEQAEVKMSEETHEWLEKKEKERSNNLESNE